MQTFFNFNNRSKSLLKSTPLFLVMLAGGALVLIEEPQFAAIATIVIAIMGVGLLVGQLLVLVQRHESLAKLHHGDLLQKKEPESNEEDSSALHGIHRLLHVLIWKKSVETL